MGMTHKHTTAPADDGNGQSKSHAERTDTFRTRRDLLAMAFGCTAAAAVAGIRTQAGATSDEVFDGGRP